MIRRNDTNILFNVRCMNKNGGVFSNYAEIDFENKLHSFVDGKELSVSGNLVVAESMYYRPTTSSHKAIFVAIGTHLLTYIITRNHLGK